MAENPGDTLSISNATSAVFNAPVDFLRLAHQRARSLALFFVPEQLDGIFGRIRGTGGNVIADATSSDAASSVLTRSSSAFAQGGAQASATPQAGSAAASGGLMSFQGLRSIGGIFNYAMSRWAMTTFLVVYASSRVPLQLRWYIRLALYLTPILLMLRQTQTILQVMRCQTSPDWSTMRWNDAEVHIGVDMAGEGGFLHSMSSTLLFWQDDLESCEAVNMAGRGNADKEYNGSLGQLWPLFISICYSQFIETLACALQGRQPQPETGMTIFEHSLAFAETETTTIRPFEVVVPPPNSTTSGAPAASPTGAEEKYVTRAEIFNLINASPEVLLISLISSLSHLSSNILAVLGLRDKLRLVNTSISGLAYMAAFVWSASTLGTGAGIDSGILRFPIVCLVGFVPHLMMIIGLIACAIIYGLALMLTALSPRDDDEVPRTFRERIALAHRNLQANVHLSSGSPIIIGWQDDFYTSLLKAGFTILTAASEAVYLNEASHVKMNEMTWLEDKRLDELAARQRAKKRMRDLIPPEIRNDLIYGGSIDHTDVDVGRSSSGAPGRSGYGRERRTRTARGPRDHASRELGGGFSQRRGKLAMLIDFGKSVSWVSAGLLARATLALLNKVGVAYRPGWLANLAGQPRRLPSKSRPSSSSLRTRRALEFWILNDEGSLQLPTNNQVDVEAETRRRMQFCGELEGDDRSDDGSQVLSTHLYQWWKSGGWWGEVDSSGEYAPSFVAGEEDDTTSLVSATTEWQDDDENPDWIDEDVLEESGRRTPTQAHPHPSRTRSLTPVDDTYCTSRLAALLDPATPQDREEAVMLSRRLRSSGPITRSQYRRDLDASQSRIFANAYKALDPLDEERALEQFILERRGLLKPSEHASLDGEGSGRKGWQDGGEGMGSGGPQCVVCHSAPRTILMWPCGCLSLCDECRVGLATRNFNTCVCCRTDVGAFSRLYVP